ncbi:anthranilate 1,2-dioxygenase system ferredoxin--NAD(+) reductase component [Arthrobacter sp. Hiyo4]|nr:anthranilate 1,2-dioxygenase system ferredoxin--NAD(+) reductase component [Arthrobacter sp. Hiyo4]
MTIIGAERHHPHLRPPPSKEYLLGTTEDTVPVVPPGWYAENDVDLRLSARVTGIRPDARTVALDDSSTLSYSSLLHATGAAPRTLHLPGSDIAGVSIFRTLDDSRRLRSSLAAGGGNVVMIGSGWIGMELAAAAATFGNKRRELPASRLSAGTHRPRGAVTGMVTDSGEALPADIVVIAVGVVPETGPAQAAGLALDNRILTDASLRTSTPGIFAAGDIANALHPSPASPTAASTGPMP